MWRRVWRRRVRWRLMCFDLCGFLIYLDSNNVLLMYILCLLRSVVGQINCKLIASTWPLRGLEDVKDKFANSP